MNVQVQEDNEVQRVNILADEYIENLKMLMNNYLIFPLSVVVVEYTGNVREITSLMIIYDKTLGWIESYISIHCSQFVSFEYRWLVGYGDIVSGRISCTSNILFTIDIIEALGGEKTEKICANNASQYRYEFRKHRV